jgi:hypothetical protein
MDWQTGPMGPVRARRLAEPIPLAPTLKMEDPKQRDGVGREALQPHFLVLKEAEDPGFLPRLFGSEDMHLLRKCPCPVWLTKPGGSANYGTVLASVDLDIEGAPPEAAELNRRILTLASSLAVSDFAALHVLHVWNAPGEGMIRLWSEASDL